MNRNILLTLFIVLLLAVSGCNSGTGPPTEGNINTAWEQSYDAGYTDTNGKYAGGSEIMHIVPHKGRLYAFNGYWEDFHYPGQSSQVLRLDSADATWEVDLETGDTGLIHMKGNILKSVTFTTDKNGNPTNKTLLIAASQTFPAAGRNAVSVFVRDDNTGDWSHSILQEGSSSGIRRVPRDMEVYHDPVTGVDRVFLLLGDPGILSGVYDSAADEIVWDSSPEHPTGGSTFAARPLGIAEANGYLYFSVAGKIFQRTNGQTPGWSLVYEIPGVVNTDVGGIRGLTAIDNPTGPGESLIFVWTPSGGSKGDIKRLDGIALTEHNETTLRKLFNDENISGDAMSSFSLGGYNRFFPVVNPLTGDTVHLVGYEQRITGFDLDNLRTITWHGYYKGAMYSIRTADQVYSTQEVNGTWEEGKPILIAPRAFAHSPFPGEEGVIYFGGHDANFNNSTDMAWIFKAGTNTVLGH